MDTQVAPESRAFDANARNWRDDVEFRARCVTQLRDGLVRAQERLRRILVTEIGTPVAMTYGIQLAFPIEEAGFWPDQARRFAFLRDAGTHSGLGRTFRQKLQSLPVGVVAAITPWNAPLYLNVTESVPALLAGNAGILKPAQLTPWAGLELGRIAAEETDIPPGIFQVVVSNDNDVAAALTADPRVDMVTFTGSTAVGKLIMERAALNVPKMTLELGGKSPHLVFADADLDAAAKAATSGVFFNAGQVCSAGTRLLVEDRVYDEMAERLVARAAVLKVGDPGAEDTYVGPLISQRQLDRVIGYVEKGVAEGARLRTGGRRLDCPGYFVPPTIFSDVDNAMTIAREEIFGPVLSLLRFSGDDEAVAIANDSPYSL
ncbi:MAG: aldehyde dehydrogenase family protein, partial [Solirubrobacteraceae bacterium]